MGEMGKLYHAVKKRGLTERQMEKFWSGNAMRVMQQVLQERVIKIIYQS